MRTFAFFFSFAVGSFVLGDAITGRCKPTPTSLDSNGSERFALRALKPHARSWSSSLTATVRAQSGRAAGFNISAV
jgi:hypothetical protein